MPKLRLKLGASALKSRQVYFMLRRPAVANRLVLHHLVTDDMISEL
jgi:hypothetical protein